MATSNNFSKGLHDIGDGCFAYLQPDGGWGWSNAGLVTSGKESLLVDTLFDLALTRDMLDQMSAVTATAPIRNLVNTHANGDHCYGNELVTGAQIIAPKACAEEMLHTPPDMLAQMMKAAPNMGDLGQYLLDCFGDFDFEGITLTPPTVTFEQRHQVIVGDTAVDLYEVGPAHTQGDVIAHVPESGVVYTGDILFIEGTPLMWAGPIANWVAACDLILELDASRIVPGHGPITDAAGVERVKEYLQYVDTEARARHAAGMTAEQAAADISLGQFAGWLDSERLAVNVDGVYRELDPTHGPSDVVKLFTMMSKLAV